MPVFITRLSAFALLVATLLSGLGCSGGALGDLLDPTKTKKSEGFDNGVGGGQVIKDLFPGARFVREAPKIIDFQPAESVTNVNIRSVITITFSESINKSSVTADSVVLRESGGGAVPINAEQLFVQSQTVLVLAPQSNLKESTSYEVVVSSSVEDLQGQKLDIGTSGGGGSGGGGGGTGGGGTGGGGTGGGGTGSGGSTARYTFKTGVDDPNTKFSIVQVSPLNRAGFVYRLAASVVTLNEPALLGGGSNALDNTNNFVVSANGKAVTGKFSNAAGSRVVQFEPDVAYPPDAKLKVTLRGGVLSQNGRKLQNGTDFSFECTVFETDSPTDITFPQNHRLTSPVVADGFISGQDKVPNKDEFPTDVTFDNGVPDEVTLIFLDAAKQNGLIFQESAAAIVSFTVDLQPEADVEALGDGEILVGSYGTKRGQNGPVDVVRKLLKDLGGFEVTALGPPTAGDTLQKFLVTPMRNPPIYGQSSDPLGSIQVTLTGGQRFEANILNFGTPFEFPGQGSFFELADDAEQSLANVFITAPFSQIGVSFDPMTLQNATGHDAFGNAGTADLSNAGLIQAGVIGGDTKKADQAGGLLCEAVADDTFHVLADTDVIVETFPPVSGAQTRLIKRVPNADFSAADLATLAGDFITVTFIKDGYHLLTLAGLPNPARTGKEYGLRPILQPATTGVKVPIKVAFDNTALRVRLASNVGLTQDGDDPFFDDDEAADISEALVLPNRLKAFAVLAETTSGKLRLATKMPIYSDTVAAVRLELNKAFVYDATTKSISIATSTDSMSLANANVFVDPSEVNFAEAHLVARLPGFPGVLGIARQGFDAALSGTISTTQLLPAALTVNNTPDAETLIGEDSDLELMIQPNLSDPDTLVNANALQEAILTEMVIRNGTDGRKSLVRSQIDFTNPSNPVVAAPLAFPVVPNPVADSTHLDLTHPPLITMEHTLPTLESVYRMALIHEDAPIDPADPTGPKFDRRWDVYLPPGVGAEADKISMRFPDLATVEQSGDLVNSVVDFSLPGTYRFFFEGFDFDTGTGTQFQFSQFLQSELDREVMRYVRFKNNISFTTN